MFTRYFGLALAGCLIFGCSGPSDGTGGTQTAPPSSDSGSPSGMVNEAAIQSAGNGGEWLSYGRTYEEQRFSPLDAINRESVSRLGLAWYADLDTARGQEATPLVIDGKIYTTTAWSKVKAFDARTGEIIWEYDPEVPGATGAKACCDVVNRGLAAWGDRLYFGTLDGRLIALDRATGEPVWTVETVDASQPYTITGAPRVVDGLVIIGNGGADMGAVRGFVSAYDAGTGDMAWRFYTVPDNPANGPQPDYLERAAETWTGEWWRHGGGGTVWDAMAYDPELGLLYIGVGNGAPWNQQFRSPGGGDNLYLSSIVAINAKSGEYVWHFQTTPGETWDFTATQHIMLADLDIDGETRKVLMQAPKNGFFYVLDRETGEFISANNYTRVTWALGIDPETGRPIGNSAARYKDGTVLVAPGALGGHNWHPMAFNPEEGLVYIPAQNVPQPYSSADVWSRSPLGWNTGVGADVAPEALAGDSATRFVREAQPETAFDQSPPPEGDYQPVEARTIGMGALVAWDPVAQQERWRVDYPSLWNGGLLATGGGLVFQGTTVGEFRAYDAASGEQIWSYPIQTGAIAAPMTFELDGEQYVAVMAGWGGVFGLLYGVIPNRSRLLVFKLDGEAQLPDPIDTARVIDPPAVETDPEKVALGGSLYGRFCVNCHAGGSVVTDLNYSAAIDRKESWLAVLRDGVLEPRGMVSFADVLNESEMEAIREYVISRAQAKAKTSRPNSQ